MKKKSKTNNFFLIALVILFALSSLINSYDLTFNVGYNDNCSEYYKSTNLDNENLKLSKISGKIHIINNSGWVDFRNDGNCTGSGTYSDPYVIEDLEIDGGGSGSCIWIENSNVYFRIENCTLYNSEDYPNHAGIRFSNVNTSQLINNTCSSNDRIFFRKIGIFLRYSDNNTISGNTVNDNSWGIYLEYSDNNAISGNTANNNEHGIRLYKSDYNTISGNTVSSNDDHGIRLSGSDNNDISGNTVNNNDGSGICLEGCDNNDILGNTANNNYNGVYLSSGLINMEVRGCYNNIISKNTANNNYDYGIYLEYSDNNAISGNTANYNKYGISLSSSDYNTITGNILLGNDECIQEENCEGNVFKNNDCGEGIALIILISSISGGTLIGIATFLLIRRKRIRKK